MPAGSPNPKGRLAGWQRGRGQREAQQHTGLPVWKAGQDHTLSKETMGDVCACLPAANRLERLGITRSSSAHQGSRDRHRASRRARLCTARHCLQQPDFGDRQPHQVPLPAAGQRVACYQWHALVVHPAALACLGEDVAALLVDFHTLRQQWLLPGHLVRDLRGQEGRRKWATGSVHPATRCQPCSNANCCRRARLLVPCPGMQLQVECLHGLPLEATIGLQSRPLAWLYQYGCRLSGSVNCVQWAATNRVSSSSAQGTQGAAQAAMHAAVSAAWVAHSHPGSITLLTHTRPVPDARRAPC